MGEALKYPKIETLFDRDAKTFKVIPGALRLPEFDLVRRWLVTEKIDGTNIRVHLRNDGTVSYGGRTEKAQPYAPLVDWLRIHLAPEIVSGAFEAGTEAVLFGEGYGARIQKGGGAYRDGVAFRLFDVMVIGEKSWWLTWASVEDIGRKLGIHTVPLLAEGETLAMAAQMVRGNSVVAKEDGGSGRQMEGIVARTEPLLFTRANERLMWKLKARDF